MLSRIRLHAPAWRRALRRRRRLLLVLATVSVLAALVPSLLPPSARGVEVVVADAPLEAGAVLTPSDLRTTRVAAELVPTGSATDISQVLGRLTRVPLPAGTPLLPGMLEDPDALQIPEGSVAMVVPSPEALVPHLSPGTGIVLLVSDPTGVETLSIPAEVLDVITPAGSATALGTGTGGAEIVVAVGRTDSREVAQALRGGSVIVAVIG